MPDYVEMTCAPNIYIWKEVTSLVETLRASVGCNNITNLIGVMPALPKLKGRAKMLHAANHVEGGVLRRVGKIMSATR